MHKFLRSIGFSTYRKKRDIEKLLASLIPSAKWRRIQLDEETNLCELRAEVAPGMGIVMMGEMDEEGAFQCEYYYPYLNSPDVSSTTDCSIQRHTEKETYAGLLDEYRVGISLIFYLENCFEYRDGAANCQLLLADEITPDTCRFWDSRTHEPLDIDRFRRDLGNVEQAYQEVLHRMMGLEEEEPQLL